MLPEDLPFRTPLTEERVAGCIAALTRGWSGDGMPGVLDVGCGNGEALARLREHRLGRGHGDCAVLGVDPDGAALERARQRHGAIPHAVEAARWHHGPWDPDLAAGAPWDAALCLGSRHAFGAGPGAPAALLDVLAARLVPAGRLWIADAIWLQDPDPDYLAATGLGADELLSLPAWHALFAERGLRVLHATLTSPDEMEAYERVFWARGGDHWDAWSRAFLRWGKETMGFAAWVLELRTPS